MREFTQSGGVIFFSSHVLEVVERLCDEVAIIRAGRACARCGPVADAVCGDEQPRGRVPWHARPRRRRREDLRPCAALRAASERGRAMRAIREPAVADPGARGLFGINRALHARDARQRQAHAGPAGAAGGRGSSPCCSRRRTQVTVRRQPSRRIGLHATPYRRSPRRSWARWRVLWPRRFSRRTAVLFGLRGLRPGDVAARTHHWQVVLSRMGAALRHEARLFALVLAMAPCRACGRPGTREPAQMAGTAATMALVCLCMPLFPVALATAPAAYGLAALCRPHAPLPRWPRALPPCQHRRHRPDVAGDPRPVGRHRAAGRSHADRKARRTWAAP